MKLRDLEVWEMEEVIGGCGRLCRAWEFLKDAFFVYELVDPKPHSNPDNVLVVYVEDRSSGWTAPNGSVDGMR